MFQYYNAHPKGKSVPDCVVRATSVFFQKDYLEMRRELNRAKKELGFRTYSDSYFLKKYLKNWHSLQAIKGQPRMNGERFCQAFPKGRYLLSIAGHLSVCVDGVLYDTWDVSQKCVYGYWEEAKK